MVIPVPVEYVGSYFIKYLKNVSSENVFNKDFRLLF